jgi:UDP-N-acetylmuramate dehydrogenase
MKILKNQILAPYTTFGIGGPADYFVIAKTKEEIIEAVNWSKKKKVPYLILGKGSNLLISDKGFRGLVIKNLNTKYSPPAGGLNTKIIVGSGLPLAKLLLIAKDNKLTGLEFLAGIPGTVGGAIAGNAGTKYGSVSQAIEKVTVLGEDDLVYDLDRKECQFEYRSSRFQNSKEIILEAILELKKEKPTIIKQKIREVLETRKNQPRGKNAGSIFKNPPGQWAGYLIEKAGLKGKKRGQAKISEKHADWIINLGKAKASDVVKLIRLCQRKVQRKFKIKLALEIRLIGEFDKKIKIF